MSNKENMILGIISEDKYVKKPRVADDIINVS